jgi:predicted DNA-binding transcriptional regulator YafY
MAATKNALIRYKVLDRCFRNPGRRYFIDDLIKECSEVLNEMNPEIKSISRRQILDDIDFMESGEGWSIDLERTRVNRKVYYRYSDLAYSINNMPLNQLEVAFLQEAMETLTHFKGMPKFEWFQELIPKLKEGMSQKSNSQPFMEMDNNLFLKGLEFLEPLYTAINNKQPLLVSYQSFEKCEVQRFTIHPYYLKSFNQRWFLFGYNPETKNYAWNLALDRIQKIDELRKPYHENTEIDWAEYFDDFIGVTRPENAKIENVTLHFHGTRGKYVETKPIHGSQKLKWLDDNTCEVNLKLMINKEFVSMLLSYGEDLTIIQPEVLKEIIKDKLKKALGNYE